MKMTTLFRHLLLSGLLAFSGSSLAITLEQATAYASGFGSGFGTLIDIWKVSESGNDNVDTVAAALARNGWGSGSSSQPLTEDFNGVSTKPFAVTELARNEDYIYQDGLLNVTLYPEVLSSQTSEANVGLWAYLGKGTVDVLAVASAGYVALYGYDAGAKYGGWTTGDIAAFLNPDSPKYQGMSHITAYSISPVPLPATAPLFLAGLLLFGFLNRKRSRA
ncbi:MAG TPA: hypothetical protein ENI93_04875 [Gammaproteobacteria bacterium]|nr:hypothetical protein [Gammaproteobacteria bacterium]